MNLLMQNRYDIIPHAVTGAGITYLKYIDVIYVYAYGENKIPDNKSANVKKLILHRVINEFFFLMGIIRGVIRKYRLFM